MRVFKQQICGFDLLRSDDDSSFVIDVNGWSFVKGSLKVCLRLIHDGMMECAAVLQRLRHAAAAHH